MGYTGRGICAADSPGAADTVHYRMSIPESAGNKITLMRVCAIASFRGMATHEAFAGQPDPASPNGFHPTTTTAHSVQQRR